jgi:hypothetical protein
MIDLKDIPTDVLERELTIRSMPSRKRHEALVAKLTKLRAETVEAWSQVSFQELRGRVIGALDEAIPLAR